MTTNHHQITYLAGGCFWGMEELLRHIPGVLATEVGYCGGSAATATYAQVRTGQTDHAESLKIEFDAAQLSYEHLLFEFFRMHNPTTLNSQGNDFGTPYRSVIFYVNGEQFACAKNVIQRVDASGEWRAPVVTELLPYQAFYPAESYHQKYLRKNPVGYTCHFVRQLKLGE
ncbi:MAG: peptide-methionine (S)-S-oxide reductase MsrA [Gallionella sp.]